MQKFPDRYNQEKTVLFPLETEAQLLAADLFAPTQVCKVLQTNGKADFGSTHI